MQIARCCSVLGQSPLCLSAVVGLFIHELMKVIDVRFLLGNDGLLGSAHLMQFIHVGHPSPPFSLVRYKLRRR